MNCVEQLYNLYYKDVFHFVLSRIRDDDIAFDITQDTFLRACENLKVSEQKNDEKTKSWLLTVANNLCIDYWRKKENSTLSINETNGVKEKYERIDDGDPLQSIKSEQIRTLISGSIKLLKEEHQQAITLFDLKQLTYKECAEILGISDTAFSSLLRRARKALIAEMIKRSAPNVSNELLTDRELKKIIYWFDLLDIPTNIDEEIVSKSRNFFNGIRENYERTRAATYPKKINEFLISTVDLKATDIVADLGCGTGDLSFKLSNEVKKIYAVDHSVEMLNMLKENMRINETTNIQPVLAEVGSEFIFPDELVNVAFCTMVLHHIFDPVSALKRISKILLPGGHLIIADIAYTNENWKYKEAHDFWSGFKLSQIAKWLEKADFKIIHLEENYEHSFKFADVKHDNKRIEIPLIYAHAIKK